MSARALSRLVTCLPLAGLAVILTSIFMWGVIGKHRLDEDARYVFKATRAICGEPRELPCELPPRVELPAPPSHDADVLVLDSLPMLLVADIYLASPARSPPGA